jgi:threonine dehydrogenase-like Zn-dependent dehydrogenase
MNALRLSAQWQPKPGYVPGERELRTRTAQSGSSVWRHPRLEYTAVEEPALAPDEVRIEVAAIGICGSDMHMYEADAQGYMLYPGLTRFPNTLGHEYSGRIVEVGSAVEGLRVGDLVTSEEVHWCGTCGACRRGLVNHCTRLEELGFTIPGAMAERVVVGAKYVYKVDEIAERLGDEAEALVMGATVEPTGVAYHALFNRLGTWKPGMYVAVFGGGPIGLAAIALARAAGASQVIALDISPGRLEMARTLGATAGLDPRGLEPNAALLELTRGHGVDFVVEAAGAPLQTLSPLTHGLAVGASIVHIGRSEQPTPLTLEAYQVRGVQLAGSLGHSGHGTFPNVIRLMASGRLDLRPMISARLPLSEGIAAFKRLERREDAKIMLFPKGGAQ